MKRISQFLLPGRGSRIAGLLIAIGIATVAAQGAVMGSIATAGCATPTPTCGNSANVVVSLTNITFGTPRNLVVTSSNLTYGAGTPLAVTTTGTISDLTLGTLPVDFFMTFNGTPLDFKLLNVGPGDTTDPHDCSAATSNGHSCSVVLPGNVISPLILQYDNGGTDVNLFVSGTVTDGSGVTSNWSGRLGTTLSATLDQITNPAGQHVAPTPQNIVAYFTANPTGSITSSHSDTFTATVAPVPEPGTLTMAFAGLGLTLLSLVRRRRS